MQLSFVDIFILGIIVNVDTFYFFISRYYCQCWYFLFFYFRYYCHAYSSVGAFSVSFSSQHRRWSLKWKTILQRKVKFQTFLFQLLRSSWIFQEEKCFCFHDFEGSCWKRFKEIQFERLRKVNEQKEEETVWCNIMKKKSSSQVGF